MKAWESFMAQGTSAPDLPVCLFLSASHLGSLGLPFTVISQAPFPSSHSIYTLSSASHGHKAPGGFWLGGPLVPLQLPLNF